MMNNAMNEMQTDIERIVMRRVHLIRVLRIIISGGVFALLLSVLMLWGIGQEVWVARVFQNAPQGDVASAFSFWFAAFTHTRFIVQMLVLLTVASFAYFVLEIVRLVLDIFIPHRA